MNKQKGQSLWEIIIALTIASLVAVGLIRSTSTAVKTTRFSRDQTEATALAQKKLSSIVDSRYSDPAVFWTRVPNPGDTYNYPHDISNVGYCIKSSLFNDYNSLDSSTPNRVSAKLVKVSVDIYWAEEGAGTDCGSKNYQYTLHFDTHVSN
ncbi:type II secretion system GspH family protein [Patescibacteria group bacterium]|nr:type II secretion system GspH family protein [Patescibacteria group bacterium]